MVKSRRRLTKVALMATNNMGSRLNIGSIVVHSLNKGGDMLPTSFGNSFPKEGISGHENPLLWCNASLINLCARHLNGWIAIGSFWEAVFHGLSSTKGMIWFVMILQWPVEKSFWTPCKIMVGLSRNILLGTWKKPRRGLLGCPWQIQFNLGGQRLYWNHKQLSCHLEG